VNTIWLLRPIYRFLERWYKTRQEAHNWTAATCPKCYKPAASPIAVFCSHCGSSLIADKVPTQNLTDPILSTAPYTHIVRATDPMVVLQLTGPILTPYLGKSTQEIKKIILARNPPPDTQHVQAIRLKNKVHGVASYQPRLTQNLAKKKEEA
jgi:hypothetical protein